MKDTTQTPCTADPDRWYSKSPANIASCIQDCLTCPVREQCLRMALEHHETADDTGVWGGTTPQTRAQMLADEDAADDQASASENHFVGRAA